MILIKIPDVCGSYCETARGVLFNKYDRLILKTAIYDGFITVLV